MLRNKQGTFKRFLTSYILIFSIPLITGLFVYQNMIGIIKDDCKEYNIAMLEQCKDLMDARMQEINGIVVQLNDNLILDNLMLRLNYNSSESYYKIVEIWKNISSFSLANNFICDFFIYKDKEDLLISTRNIYTHLTETYGSQIEFGDLTLKQFKNAIFVKSNQGSFLPENILAYKKENQYDNRKVITYLRSLPVNSNSPRGSIVFFIPTVNVQNILHNMYTRDGGSSLIMDSEGKVLLSYPNNTDISSELTLQDIDSDKTVKDVTVNGKKAVKYQIRSKYNGLIYVSTIPYEIIMKRVNNIKGLLFSCLSAMFLIGIILSYMMAYRNSRPISELINLLTSSTLLPRGGRRNEFDFLKGSVSNLIFTNKNMQQEIDQKLDLLRNDFFGKLIRSDFTDREEIDTYLFHIKKELPEASYVAIIIYLRSYGDNFDEAELRESIAVKVLLNSYFEKNMPDMICFYDYDFDKAVVLLPVLSEQVKNGNTYDFKKYLEINFKNVCSLMKENFHFGLSFAVGMQIDDKMRIGDSVNTALRALQSSTLEEKITWYSDLPVHPKSNYSIETEIKIINLARAGNYEEIMMILDDLFNKCFVKNSPSRAVLKQLVYDLKGTLFQIAVCELPQDSYIAANIYDFIDRLDHCLPYDAIWKELLKIYRGICSFFNEQKRSHNVQVSHQIKDYVLKNYHNPQLSLSNIACYFNMSEVYISQLFKEQNGQNFSDYLENIRIEAACNRLIDSGLSIQQISEAAGYNNTHTFRQAFKRVVGISPTSYKSLGYTDRATIHN